MKLLKLLIESFVRKPSMDEALFRHIEVLNKESRLHPRYPIGIAGVMRLRLSAGPVGIVRDLSYSGLGVQFPIDALEILESINSPSEGLIEILEFSFPCTVFQIRKAGSSQGDCTFVGFALHHNDPKTLIALRDVIEPLRCGSSMLTLDPLICHERYRSPEWHCLRGDGPTDLILRHDKNAQLAEALLTFRLNDAYCELSFSDNTLKTGQMLGNNNSKLTATNQMASTAALDPTLLRYSICILLGTTTHFKKSTEGLLWECLRHLKVETHAKSA